MVAQVFYEQLGVAKPTVFLSDGSDLMTIEDPFGERNSHSALNPSPDAVGVKIANITRALASLGVALRTDMAFRSKHSSKGTLQALEAIEHLIQQLSKDNNAMFLLQDGRTDHSSTIHQQPNLSMAMNIIV